MPLPLLSRQETGAAPAISYASSGVLAKQIEQGAPADIFISANVKWMDYLDKAKLLKPGTRRNLLGNALVLIEPADANTKLEIAPGFGLAAAIGDGKLAVCTVASCPAGIYGKQALVKLGIWKDVEPKLAQASNVRDALMLVARGRGEIRHRLRDGREGGAEGQGRRHLPRIEPCSDRLSHCDRGEFEQSGGARFRRLHDVTGRGQDF